jgi:hypothetical protein
MAARTSLCAGICSSSPVTPGLRPSHWERTDFPKRSSSPQSRSSCHSPCTGHVQSHQKNAFPDFTAPRNTHWDLVDLEDVRWYVSLAQRGLDGSANRLLERRVQLMPRTHLDEQQHTVVFVLQATLANAYCVFDASGKLWALKHDVNLVRTKIQADSGFQHAVACSSIIQHISPRGKGKTQKLRIKMRTCGRRLCIPSCAGSWR